MKKMQIYAWEFGYGGVEREIITLANSLVNVFNIEIIFMYKSFDIIPYKINSKIKITYIENEIKINSFMSKIIDLRLKKYIKNKISNIDAVISTNILFNKYIDNANISNKIYWEHNHHNNTDEILSNVLKNTMKFKTIVVPTKDLEEYYKKNSKLNVVMIPNLVELNGDLVSNLNNKTLISVGKLKEEKGFTKLLDVMELINKSDPSIKLHIIGDGELRSNLEEIIKKKRLNRVVSLFGTLEKNEIIDEYMNSGLFVMCSENESFCLSLIEAMSVGLPGVVFYEDSLKDIIRNDINGYLVKDKDIKMMAKKILDIMHDDETRRSLGNCAKETVLFYDVNSLKSEWIKII